MPSSIDVTVAAVIEHDGRFLLVEERACGRVVFNQPAGHLEPDESLLDAVARETLEETGYRFDPQYLLGVYLWRNDEAGTSYLRVTFTGAFVPPRSTPVLDDGIIAVHWMTRSQLLGLRSRLRSPMVLRCVDDYCAGIRYPLDCLTHLDLPNDRAPATKNRA
jgi:8-oxo-dGTP pyrophosphatase MutT (NUDIX family)